MIIDCQRCGLTEGRWIDNGEHGLGSTLACERCGAFIKPLRFKVEEAEPEYAGWVPYAPDRVNLWEIGFEDGLSSEHWVFRFDRWIERASA